VACVGASEISGATFAHWATVDANSRPRRDRRPSEEPNRAQMVQVMGFLIANDWLIGEAAELHIAISAAAVRRRFDRLRHQQFPKRRRYVAFLKRTGETTADLMLRVQVSLLSARIQRRVIDRQRGAHAQQEALTRFSEHLRDEWTARTYCNPVYKVPACGHALAS